MAINKITTKSIKDLEISAADLAPGTITGAKIAPATVESSNIAPGTIANDRLANTGITINGTSIALGASGEIVAGTDWQAVTVADGSTTVNATAGQGYFLDTNAGVIEVFLPTSPSRGDTIVLADYSGTFAQNRVIVNTGGVLIDSSATGDVQLTTNNTIAEFVYIDAAKGWLVKLNQAAGTTPSSVMGESGGYDTKVTVVEATGGTVTTSGDFKIHTFTGDGCFTVSTLSPLSPAKVDYLVVAGGGASGDFFGAGGGAGGFRESKDSTLNSPHTASPLAATSGITVTATTYPIIVGGGGADVERPGVRIGNPGSNSVFSTITSTGGGGGGGNSSPGTPTPGQPGGSGGGGGGYGGTSGTGNTPPTNPPQGNPGGASPTLGGSGGGGATAAGGDAGPAGGPGAGGEGAGTGINPSPTVGTPGPSPSLRYFAGGGAGSSGATPFGVGGGGGGPGSGYNSPLSDGVANTGGGGANESSSGGKGIVIIRYKFQN